MATKSPISKPSGSSIFRVRSRVCVRIGLRDSLGTIIEDRGLIGAGGRRLWGVRVDFDQSDGTYIELPEEEMTLVPPVSSPEIPKKSRP